MCGIVGVISTLSQSKTTKWDNGIVGAFDDMLWADQLRGVDGTGIMALDSTGDLVMAKSAGSYTALKGKKDVGKIFNFVDTNHFTIGHNRSATKGVKDNAANAHPFLAGNICLVHNGTLHWVAEKYKDKNTDLDVDSKAAAEAINDLGIEKAIDEMSGAYAFVWIDKKQMTLNVLRNNERPLGYIKAGPYLLLASEPSLAVWCASRNGVKFDSDSKIEAFEPNHLYTWEVETLEFSKKKVEKKWASYGGYDGYYSGYQGGVSSAGFPKSHTAAGTYQKPFTQAASSNNRSGSKERVRLLSPSSPECPYTVGEKVIFKPLAAKEHKNLSRLTNGEIDIPHAGIKDKHRVVGNMKFKANEVIGENQLLAGYISAVYKTDSGFFIFELRDIVKHIPVSYMPVVVPKKEEKGNVVDMKSGDLMVSCDCCGTMTPENKLVSKKRSITDTDTGVRVKMKFRVCPTCDVTMNKDDSLIVNMTEKRMAEMGGLVQ